MKQIKISLIQLVLSFLPLQLLQRLRAYFMPVELAVSEGANIAFQRAHSCLFPFCRCGKEVLARTQKPVSRNQLLISIGK